MPLFINQERLNDQVHDLYLSKKAEVLGSRLEQWNLLEPKTTIASFHSHNQNLARYYASAKDICSCKDVDCLMTEEGCEHNLVHWRLFIDFSILRKQDTASSERKPMIQQGFFSISWNVPSMTGKFLVI